jgi:3-phenylpropionate/cinnamic acid dioxygenase small subunit
MGDVPGERSTEANGARMTDREQPDQSGVVHDERRVADVLAIQDLVTPYAHAVDDGDWRRWEALFLPDARIDYTSAGGIAGTPAELAVWMPEAMAVFEFCLHSVSTHEIRFTGPDTARGRVHVFNRNGVRHEGEPEIVDVGAVYVDTYARDGDRWRFSSRIEHTTYITGGSFATIVRDAAVAGAQGPGPFG